MLGEVEFLLLFLIRKIGVPWHAAGPKSAARCTKSHIRHRHVGVARLRGLHHRLYLFEYPSSEMSHVWQNNA